MGLVGHWPFDDGDVDDGTAVDASGNGNDGDVNGVTSTSPISATTACKIYRVHFVQRLPSQLGERIARYRVLTP